MIPNKQLPPAKQDEVERLKTASARLVRRAQGDPAFAHQLLEEIGYFDAVSDSQNGSNGTGNGTASDTFSTAVPAFFAATPASSQDRKGKVLQISSPTPSSVKTFSSLKGASAKAKAATSKSARKAASSKASRQKS